MRVGIVAVFVDYHRRGNHHRGILQPQIGGLIAALLPDWVEVEVINDTWTDPDWSRDYDLLFFSAMHAEFDRARQMSHYWRRRGAKTVIGGSLATLFPQLCAPYFDAVACGEPEEIVPRIFEDFCRRSLKRHYAPTQPSHLHDVPTPRFDLVTECQWLPVGVEASRGCPFQCEFCVLTGMGSRFTTRSPQQVVSDLRRGIAALTGWRFAFRRDIAIFYDNNLGGDFAWLRRLCTALEPLGIRWGCSLTFNAASNQDIVARLAHAGCGFMYVGIESFNAPTLEAMNKRHNVVRKTRQMIAGAHRHGILVTAGLMVSPSCDDVAYIRSIPRQLEACGLHVPTYICFETPFPGTPLFEKVASAPQSQFLPNALLRDFNTYTLVTRPQRAPLDEFVAAYREVLAEVYAPSRRLKKVARDAVALIPAGGWKPLAADIIDQWTTDLRPDPGRSYVTGSERAPPEAERVPLCSGDFTSEVQWREIMEPWRVTDAEGRLLPDWRPTRSPSRELPLPARTTQPAASAQDE